MYVSVAVLVSHVRQPDLESFLCYPNFGTPFQFLVSGQRYLLVRSVNFGFIFNLNVFTQYATVCEDVASSLQAAAITATAKGDQI